MECDICGKMASSRLRFHCPTCARVKLYEQRCKHAAVLMDKEDMGRRVEGVVPGLSSKIPRESLSRSGKIIDTYDCAKSSEMDNILSESAALQGCVNVMAEKAKALRSQLEQYRSNIKAQKANNQQRRSDAESATYGLADREAKELEFVDAGMRRTKRRWESRHVEIVDARAALCKPAAQLAGLRRHRRPRENGRMREYYTIGSGIPVFDLRELHTAKHDELSTSLTQLAYLTVRTANYLAVRLPAEITLPHNHYPLPTIFQPQASYQAKEMPFPGSTPNASSNNSPIASRALDSRAKAGSSPRPLFLRMPLPNLAKDDPKQYAYFVEGVALLAWDIAWLCKSQGMSGLDGFADVCAMGRNLWNLLLAERPQISDAGAADAKEAESTQLPLENYPTNFGQLSHGTAHSFLNSTEGRNIVKDWRLQSPMPVVSKTRDFLNSEIQKSEWEVLQEAEWDVEIGKETAVLVGGRRADGEQRASAKDASAKPTTVPSESDGKEIDKLVRSAGRSHLMSDTAKAPSPSGASGWMKLRTRSSEQK